MKSYLKHISLFVVLALFTASSFAQPGKRGQQRGDRNMDRMRDVPVEVKTEAHLSVFDEYLNLSDTQKDQLRQIDENFARKGTELREEKIAPRKKRMKAAELRKEHQIALHEMLTKDQYATYLEKREAIRYDIRQHLKAYNEDNK